MPADSPPETLDDRLNQYGRFGVKLGLHTMEAVCTALGQPHLATPAIHVAGTNGKGTTTAAVCAILHAANYPVGRYTSPHLTGPTERIAVNDVPVTEPALWRSLDAVDRAAAQAGCSSVTYFEALTVAAFHIFKARFVDVAVYEVGMGGRLDATNVVDPVITAITSIARDHVVHLGDNLPAIAGEKAGIIKADIPVVCAQIADEALEVICRRAAELGAPVLRWGADYGLRGEPAVGDDGWQEMTWWGTGHEDLHVRFRLRGSWQSRNVACALAVVHDLRRQGWNIKPPAIVAGLEQLRWPGRMDWLSREPAVLFDCAHNPAAMDAAAGTAWGECPDGLLPVLAVLQDKDAEGMCRVLARRSSRVVVSASEHPRALAAPALADIANAHFDEVIIEPYLEAAVPRAIHLAGGMPVFVSGSLMNYALTRRAVDALSRTTSTP